MLYKAATSDDVVLQLEHSALWRRLLYDTHLHLLRPPCLTKRPFSVQRQLLLAGDGYVAHERRLWPVLLRMPS